MVHRFYNRYLGGTAAALIAQNKACTCARDRKSSKAIGEFMRSYDRPPAYWGDMGITGFGGGYPSSIMAR